MYNDEDADYDDTPSKAPSFSQAISNWATDSVKSSPEDKEDEEKKKYNAPKYTQWLTKGLGIYYPEFHVDITPTIPSGFYSIGFDQNQGKYFAKKTEYTTDNILELPMPEIKDILKDIKTFWSRKAEFVRYDLIYKRGVLMYGPPGCGKSHVIQLVIKELIEKEKGVVFKIETAHDVESYSQFMHGTFKPIEKDRKIVTIIEDIDGLFNCGKNIETLLLNILDGMNHMDNIVYLATTNYPEELADRIMNRPSRFDRRYYIDLPQAEVRKFYLEHKLFPEDLEKINIDEWVEKSNGFSIAHLRELIVSTIILGNTFEESLKLLKELGETSPSSTKFKSGKKSVGFSL